MHNLPNWHIFADGRCDLRTLRSWLRRIADKSRNKLSRVHKLQPRDVQGRLHRRHRPVHRVSGWHNHRLVPQHATVSVLPLRCRLCRDAPEPRNKRSRLRRVPRWHVGPTGHNVVFAMSSWHVLAGRRVCMLAVPRWHVWQPRRPVHGFVLGPMRLVRCRKHCGRRLVRADVLCGRRARRARVAKPADLACSQPDQPARHRPARCASCAVPADDLCLGLRHDRLGRGR
jgi:hypothetical protein